MKTLIAKEVLKNITEEQILDILKDYGLTPVKTRENEMWFRTLCHGGDSNKLCFYRDSKTFYCYTNCGAIGDIISLVQKLESCDFRRALNTIAKKTNYKADRFIGFGIDTELREDSHYYNRMISMKRRKKTRIPVLNSLSESILTYFDKNSFYEGWIEEGISIPSMVKFDILWDELDEYIIIPHRDKDGRLIGIRRRALKEEDVASGNKYMPLYFCGKEYAHSLGSNLYGLYENLKAIKKSKKIIVAESEKSVLLSDTYFGEDSVTVATCGFNISPIQLQLILWSGAEEVILAFDKDFNDNDFLLESEKTGIEYGKYLRYKNKIQTLCKFISPYAEVSCIQDTKNFLRIKDSPFDRGKEIFEKLLETRKVKS